MWMAGACISIPYKGFTWPRTFTADHLLWGTFTGNKAIKKNIRFTIPWRQARWAMQLATELPPHADDATMFLGSQLFYQFTDWLVNSLADSNFFACFRQSHHCQHQGRRSNRWPISNRLAKYQFCYVARMMNIPAKQSLETRHLHLM